MKLPLWIEFANSLAHDPVGHGPPTDHLDDPAWRRRVGDRFDLPPLASADPPEIAELRQLRTLLHEMAASLAARGRLSPRQVKSLNQHLSASPVLSRLEVSHGGGREPDSPYRLRLDATVKGGEAVRFAIAASFAAFLVQEDPSRIRLCENPDCRWVFYDETRSRTRRWCADSCGNLMKVRRFRAKRKDTG